MPKSPSRADEQPGQIRADLLDAVAAQAATTVAVRQHRLEASTWLAVMPWRKQCAPPELNATLPPIVHTDWLEGSGA